MAYNATVVPVMIASPGDVLEERNVARDVIHEWNYVHSTPSSKVVLIPVRWETHSSPDLGGSPQQLINERVLKDCDLLIGIFWTRLGTPTAESMSGTAEEIERHISAGKPAMVYFSEKPVAPASLDSKQYSALQEFKTWCRSKGLIETFQNIPEFQTKFTRQLQITLRDSPYIKNILDSSGEAIAAAIANAPVNAPELSDEAKQLLLEAAEDKSGTILKMAYFGGQRIQTNGKPFGEPRDRRSQARWEHALEQLETEQLIRTTDPKRQLFRVTNSGYELADRIKNT